MKYFVISDNADTVVGLRLSGIEGIKVQKKEDVERAIASVVARPEIGVLLITETLATLCAAQIAPLKSDAHTPLVVEIPNRHSEGRASDSITRYIREAIGIKI